jgi:hypothetical protein
MKRLLQLVVVAGMVSFLACGPSAAEQAAEAARIDSLQKDSIAKVEEANKAIEMAKQDSIAKAAEATRVADSIAAAAKKGGKKVK